MRQIPTDSVPYYSNIYHSTRLLDLVERYLDRLRKRITSIPKPYYLFESYIGLKELHTELSVLRRMDKQYKGAINRANFVSRIILKEMRFIKRSHEMWDPDYREYRL